MHRDSVISFAKRNNQSERGVRDPVRIYPRLTRRSQSAIAGNAPISSFRKRNRRRNHARAVYRMMISLTRLRMIRVMIWLIVNQIQNHLHLSLVNLWSPLRRKGTPGIFSQLPIAFRPLFFGASTTFGVSAIMADFKPFWVLWRQIDLLPLISGYPCHFDIVD